MEQRATDDALGRERAEALAARNAAWRAWKLAATGFRDAAHDFGLVSSAGNLALVIEAARGAHAVWDDLDRADARVAEALKAPPVAEGE